MQKNKVVIIMGIVLVLAITVWLSSIWEEHKNQAFENACCKVIYFDVAPICFEGFEFEEIDTIQVVEKTDYLCLDTIFIYPRKEITIGNKEQYKRYWAYPTIKFNKNYTYSFYLDTNIPYVLTDMQMVTWAEFDMLAEGRACKMGHFSIDGEGFEHVSNITFKKR